MTAIYRPASDSWNVGAVGYVDGRGHSGRVDRVHGHDLGRERSCVRRDHGHGHGPFGGHSPSYQGARSAWSQIVCRRDDGRLFLARPSRDERDRASPCNENDSRDGTSRRRVDASGAVEIYVENVDASLWEDGLGAPQSRV